MGFQFMQKSMNFSDIERSRVVAIFRTRGEIELRS